MIAYDENTGVSTGLEPSFGKRLMSLKKLMEGFEGSGFVTL